MKREPDAGPRRLARALGWASLALGLTQLGASREVSVAAGVDDSLVARNAVLLVGARELGHAGTLLFSRSPGRWVWGRVAGDALDLTLLGRAMGSRKGPRRLRTAAATAVVAGVTAADVYAAVRALPVRAPARQPRLHVQAAITVDRPRHEVYECWHSLENLPRFMAHLESVEPSDGRSHWTAKAPMGRTVEWDAEISEDRPDEVIAWHSLPGSKVGNAGTVRFTEASGDRGTEVRVELEYAVPGGRAGAAVARLLGEHPRQQVRDDLRRFKQFMETGEVVRSEGSPEGARALRQARQRPARPVK